MEAMLEFYSGLSQREMLLMLLGVTAALALLIIGSKRKYGG